LTISPGYVYIARKESELCGKGQLRSQRDAQRKPRSTTRIARWYNSIPYRDQAQRREYDREYKQKQRSEGWTKKGLDKRLTENEVVTAEDLRDLLNEVIAEARDADGASLALETKLRIKLRAVEIGLRVIEITDHERRIAALEEHVNESTPVEN